MFKYIYPVIVWFSVPFSIWHCYIHVQSGKRLNKSVFECFTYFINFWFGIWLLSSL